MKDFYIISVAPLARVASDELDYFSPVPYAQGMLVGIPYGKRSIKGLVLECKKANFSKGTIRKSDFALKKIRKQTGDRLFPDAYLHAIAKTARLHATSFGACLLAATPKEVFENPDAFALPARFKSPVSPAKRVREYAMQDEFPSRITTLRSIAREARARGEHCFIVAPSQKHLEHIAHSLDEDSILLTSKSKKGSLARVWKSVRDIGKTQIILTTPKYLFLATLRPSTIILELEGTGWYKEIARPYIDSRILARSIASEMKSELVRSDSLLDIITIHRHKTAQIKERYGVDFTIEGTARSRILDMRNAYERAIRDPEYRSLISSELEKMISHAISSREKLLLYTLRRGFQPLLLCQDCGNRIIRKSYLEDVEKFHQGVFKSKKLEPEAAEGMADRCEVCGSWRLRPLATAILKVHEMLRERFGESIALLHSGLTVRETAAVVKQFESSDEFPVILTTEAGLYSLSESVARSAVISFDALFSIPDIGIAEKTMRILLRLHELSREEVLVQTRNPDNLILQSFKKGTILPLYRTEMEDRKFLGYPPFTRIAKIRINAHSPRAEERTGYIKEVFKDFEKDMYPSLLNTSGTEWIIILLKARTNDEWKELLSRLRNMPLDVSVDAQPTSLL